MYNYSERWPELKDFIKDVEERFNNALRPPHEVILDDLQFQEMLHISKRHAAFLREERKITYSKPSGKIYYKLSDVLDYVNRNRVEAVINTSNTKEHDDGEIL